VLDKVHFFFANRPSFGIVDDLNFDGSYPKRVTVSLCLFGVVSHGVVSE
jgi:hypothetical protein